MNTNDNPSYKNQTGLILEGGGMRGIYTAGILDVFNEHHIQFNGVVGVSAGAIHAASFVANQPGRSIRFYLAFSKLAKFMGLKSLITTKSFVNYNFAYRDLPNRIVPLDYRAIENSNTKFYITCTNIKTGTPYHHPVHSLENDEMKILCASASLPLISQIIHYRDMELLDGGTADSIPLTFMIQSGFQNNVLILTRPRGYLKSPENNALFNWMYRKYPNYIQACKTRHLRYNALLKDIDSLEDSRQIFVFRPDSGISISRLERNPEKILAMYQHGRQHALEKLDALKEFLSQKHSPKL